MELKNIKTEDDFINYIEGCLNDMEYGVSSKNETVGHMVSLFLHMINKDREKRDREKPIKKIIDSAFDEMRQSGEMEKINEDLQLFYKYKRNIYIEIASKAYFYVTQKKYDELDNYLDSFGIIPTEKELESYR